MKKVTDIKEAEKSSRFNVFTEEGFAFSLSAKGIFECEIAVGKVFSEDEFENILRYVEEEKAFSAAVRFLGYRDYSEKELLRRLARAGIDGTNAVERLVGLGYVNDERYARDFIEKNSAKYGKIRIESELRGRGIDRELIGRLLDEFFSVPDSAAFDALCKKQKMRAFSDMKEKNRAYAFLARRGFGSEEISAAFEKYEMMITGEESSE